MPWRVIAHENEVWHVDAAAERRAHSGFWQLVLSFRLAGPHGAVQRFRAVYPLEAASKSALYRQADGIPDAVLGRVIADRRA